MKSQYPVAQALLDAFRIDISMPREARACHGGRKRLRSTHPTPFRRETISLPSQLAAEVLLAPQRRRSRMCPG